MLYELFVLAAIALAATAILLPVLPQHHIAPGAWWYRAYLFIILCSYFIYSWHRGGQTLGMRPWRLYVVDNNARPPSLARAGLRCLCALLSWLPIGLGYWWMLLRQDGQTWHDRLSGTTVVHLGNKA